MTPTQLNIAVRLANDETPKAIAADLGFTVKGGFDWHFIRVKKALGIKARAPQAYALITLWAWRNGFLALVVFCLAKTCPAQPLPPTPLAVVSNTNGACAYLAWDYWTNALTSIAGFEISYGNTTNTMTNSAQWNQSSLVPLAGITNGLRTFTNRVCSLISTQTYYFAVRAYDIYGTNKSDWSNIAKWQAPPAKTNRIVEIWTRTNSAFDGSGVWKNEMRVKILTNPPEPMKAWNLISITLTNW
jgi:hypothetical protein